MAAVEPAPCRVEVAYSPAPREVRLVCVSVPAGSTVQQVLQASALVPRDEAPSLGIWGRSVAPDQVVRDGDRIEVYRGLRVDPKEARRQREQARPRKRRPAGR